MRKKIAVLLFTVAIVLTAAFSPVATFAFAEEATYTVKYVSDRGELTSVEVIAGSPIESFIGYRELIDSRLYSRDELEGQKLSFYIGDTDTPFPLPYTVNSDTVIRVVVEPTTEKVVYTYAYGLGETERHEYEIGSRVTKPTIVGDFSVVNEIFYTDENLNVFAEFAEYAEKDVTYYPLLDKTVSFTLNGETYTCRYGASVKTTVNTGTHGVKAVYTDEGKTSEYVLPVLAPIALYGDFVRTHYAVTFSDGVYNTVVYIPIEEPVLSEKDFPKGMGDVAEWRIDETKKIDFPITINDDITLHASNGLNNPITETDRILLYCAGAALLLMAGWGAIYEHRKTVKKRKIEAEIRAAGKQETPDEGTENEENTKKPDDNEKEKEPTSKKRKK